MTRLEAERLRRASTVPDLRVVEGRVARRYWEAFGKVMPERLDFQGRMTSSHQNNASDPVNLALNYAYGVLESECRRAINIVGLEPSVGFLHDFSNYQTKQSLVYDLEEPFRWLIDATIIECLEYERISRKDFYRMDNYVLRLKPEAAKKLLGALRIKFNSTTRYRGKSYGWGTVMRLKCQELASYILSRRSELDFETPQPLLPRDDSEAVRSRILSMSSAEAGQLGLRKNTLWYLQQRARNGQPIKIYNRVKKKLFTSA